MLKLVSMATVLALSRAASAVPPPVVPGVDGLLALARPGRSGLVVLHFWATWCGACRAEMPEIVRLSKELARLDIPLVGASLDPAAKAAAVGAFVEAQGLTFPNAILDSPDPAPVIARLDPSWNAALPATFLVTTSGKTLRAYLGPTPVERLLDDARRLSRATRQ